ncbi:amidohydrolase family protein [soil metagenome]
MTIAANAAVEEAPLDPDRPIIDPHHHLWELMAAPGSFGAPHRALVHETAAMIAASGQNIVQTVAVEAGAMYRAHGPDLMKPVGEVEFLRGQAAMSDSGNYGSTRIAAAIVAGAPLHLGDAVAPLLEAEVEAGGGRLRGVRAETAYSPAGMFGRPCGEHRRGLIGSAAFRAGAARLAPMGLSLDIWCFHPQLAQLGALADALPDLTIILDHIGTPDHAAFAGQAAEADTQWHAAITALAQRPNVVVKVGGMGMDVTTTISGASKGLPSEMLATRWRAYADHIIAAFTPFRAMFESNFPPDAATASYGATWNAFKRIASPLSEGEKTALFSATARRVYQLD